MDEKPDTPAELRQRALRYLARREHSRAELARKLVPHAESPQAVESLMEALVAKKQLSDERFAEERARVLSRKYGPAKIRHDLKARGVASEVIERATSGSDVERAREILRRRFPLETRDRRERARRARFLQGRGFSYDAIRGALGEGSED